MEKRDCFELLSAYLDGEVTANERKEVEELLSTDASIKTLYNRLLNLRQGFQTIPIPSTGKSSETTIEQVFTRIDQRYHLNWMLGGVAVAACILGAISGLFSANSFRTMEIAQIRSTTERTATATQTAVESPLMVALNNPVIEIPKTAIAPTQKPVNKVN
ncbi:zf-HC2 domain-containing protein [Cuspidothrix issatschenkoi LEGE 03284]|uniref:anti-sigma factor family protein n=1 Tax=Cuspidothrix issatschenkoi TaxID=230752 RepID=UPI00187EC247|nr:zf-HC2 domain-containing protein [Cuspidothrix issatschenkoi]MBE9233573.1 zf-HC2 domain-containing protein [Cuspidothrix issatschenkoi LEGE 03284]